LKNHADSHEEFNSSYACEICKKKSKLQFRYWKHVTAAHIIGDAQM